MRNVGGLIVTIAVVLTFTAPIFSGHTVYAETPANASEAMISAVLIDTAAQYQFYIDAYEALKPQWDFNVRYGAPPISSNLKKMVSSEFPSTRNNISACHNQLFGRPITSEDITRSMDKNDNSSIKMVRSMMSMTAGSVRVPQKRSDLDAASNYELLLKTTLAPIEQMMKIKTDKDWCPKFNEWLKQ